MAELKLGQPVGIIDHMVRTECWSDEFKLARLKELWPDFPEERVLQPGFKDGPVSALIRIWVPRSLVDYMKEEHCYFYPADSKRNSIPEAAPTKGIVTRVRALHNGFLINDEDSYHGYYQAKTVTRAYEVTYHLNRRPVICTTKQIAATTEPK